MTLEEAVIAKLQQLPENARQKLLVFIDAWIEQHLQLTRELMHSASTVSTMHLSVEL